MHRLFFILVLVIAEPLCAGQILEDVLNYAVIDQSCVGKDVRLELASSSPIGQTFVLGSQAHEIFRITVKLDQSPEQWKPDEAVTLSVWDSARKLRKLAEYTLTSVTVKDVIGENPFYVRTTAEPGREYFFELTHNGKGDGKAIVYGTSSDCYPKGQAMINGTPQENDLYFKVLIKREPDREKLMQRLFADFDLESPGMEKVKVAVVSRDWERAIRETVAHFDSKPLSRWHDPKVLPVKNPVAKLDAAEKALRHSIEHAGQEFFLGERINWWVDPIPGTVSPAERLCNWGLPRILGYAYINSGDERYAKKADEFYVTWMLDNPPPVEPGVDWYAAAYSGLQIARKIGENAWYFYGELMKSSNLQTDTRMAFIHFQIQLCKLIYLGLGTDGRGWGGNWGFQVYDALLESALNNPEYAEWRKWADFAVGKLVDLSKEALCADGVLNEAAPNYHAICARRLKSLLERSFEKGLAIPSDLRDIVTRMYSFMAHLTQPDGSTPMFGDSDSESYSEELLQAGKLLERPDFVYVATGGKKGKPPIEASVAFPAAGYFIMRSPFGEMTTADSAGIVRRERYDDARYLAVHNGNWVGTHGHFDLMAPVVYAYGRPLLIDPGRFDYSKEHDWFWVAKAHNVVIMDDRNYENYNHTTEYTYWASTKLLDYIDGRNHFYPDTTSDREILFVKPDYWLVTDQIYADGDHAFQQYWHFAPGEVDIDSATKVACTNFLIGGNLCVIPVFREGLSARKEEGFVAFKPGIKESAPVVVYGKKSSGSVSFAALLYPWKKEYGKSGVRVGSLVTPRTPGVLSLSVDTGDVIDYIALCRRRDSEIGWVEHKVFSSNARAALVRTKSGKVSSFSWIEGREVQLSGQTLARSERRIGVLNVEYSGGTLHVMCREHEPTLEIWTADCVRLVVNNSRKQRIRPHGMIKPFGNQPHYVLIDDADEGCSRMPSYEWTPMPDGDPVGISYSAHETDIGRGEWAEWRAKLPTVGKYELEVHIPSSLLPLSREVEYLLNGQKAKVDQSANAGRWVRLGAYSFDSGDVVVKAVNRTREDGTYFVVDAVRLLCTK